MNGRSLKRTTSGAIATFLLLCISARASGPAISYGKDGCGKLEGGISLPCDESNFEVYSGLACTLGRNYLHPLVTKTVVDAYAILRDRVPGRKWQYGDTGWGKGGRIRPHRTHQNGLSADFFMPVNGKSGQPSVLPVYPWNKFGYGIDFTKTGTYKELQIDWKAVVNHWLALKEAGEKYGVAIGRIIIDPPFQPILLKADERAAQFRSVLMEKSAWIRHDEHYHIDFLNPDTARKDLKCD